LLAIWPVRALSETGLGGRESTLFHEAGHVIGALLAGHRIQAVHLGGSERCPTNAGTTVLDWAASPDVDFFGHLIAVLMGPMAEGEPPPQWPPLPQLDGNRDEHLAATLVSHLRLSKGEYMTAVALAEHWVSDPLVKAAIAKVAYALGQAGALTDRMVREALGPELVAWFEMGPRPREEHVCSS
jgi:hypothetical protein